MLRIISIENTLSKLLYPNISETVTFDINYDSCIWNSGIWVLKIQDKKGKIEKSDDGIADVSLDVKGLTQLLASHRNAKELVEQGLAEGKQENFDKLDFIFPNERFIVRDWF